ncbi:hypothetical protein KAU51_03880 [Candidatus Parcubacteria bacterium]|nr:hypothetical protein [Candidatus Parcubacteria bacterium]
MKVCKFRVERDDKDQLRDAIFKVLSDEGLKERLGEEGKKLVRVEFGWDRIVRKIEVIYEDSIFRYAPERGNK